MNGLRSARECSMNKDETTNLVAALSEGRGCLLLGQDHTEGLVQCVLQEVSSLTSKSPTTLAGALSTVEAATLGASMAEYLDSRRVPLVELASLPWSSVVSSAVDRGFLDALAAAGTSRRLVEASPDRIALTPGVHSPATLHLFQVLGRIDGVGELAAPASDTLAAKLLLKVPRALDALPQLLGTRGVLVVEGMAPNAWLNEVTWAALEQVLRKIPAGRAYWFGWAPPDLVERLCDVVCFEQRRLTQVIAAWSADAALSERLAEGRSAVFGVDDHVFLLGSSQRDKAVRVSAKDWRELRRVGSVIDDAEVQRLMESKSERGGGGLAGFVGRAHLGVPDWQGAARGFCFPRDAAESLVAAVARYSSSAKPSVLGSASIEDLRHPTLLSGPPAIGKSVGLLHAAWQLRAEHRQFVLWLLPGPSGLDFVGIERVCRMVESRGVPLTVLVVDGVPADECIRLLDKLLSDGRRVVLIGTETADLTQDGADRGYRSVPINFALSEGELARWLHFLEKHGMASKANGERDFLSLLNAVLPESSYGSTAALLQEYERVIRSAEQVQAQEKNGSGAGPLAAQLKALFPEFIHEEASLGEPRPRFAGDPFVREILELILFCARADLPISTDTLFALMGSDLLDPLRRLSEALAATALIQEVEMDLQGTIALTTAHRLHAQWLLRALRPNASSQLEVLRNLVDRVPWNLDAYPGDNPTQDYAIRLLRQVGPRGGSGSEFQSIPALRALADVLSTIWQTHGRRNPGLLALEAILRGDLARRDSESSVLEQRSQCTMALDLLDAAVEVLRERNPSEARNFELQRVLTLAADIRGTELNILLRNDEASPDEIREILERLQRDVMLARSYDTKYHPLDILYWASRDARKLLRKAGLCTVDLDTSLLATMQMALEVAREEPMFDMEQKSRLQGRRIELGRVLGNESLAREQAAEMRARGDLAGELVLSRMAVEEAQQHPATCQEELERFLGFGAAVFADVRVLRYLCRLWIDAWSGSEFGSGRPVCCAAPEAAWEQLLSIAQARVAVPEDSEHPLTTFLLGWAQLQLGDADSGRVTFSRLERLSMGMRRRVGELAVVSSESGEPRAFVGRVQARRNNRAVLRVEGIAELLEMRPEVESSVAPSGLEVGEVARVAIALNYRGLQIRNIDEEPKQ